MPVLSRILKKENEMTVTGMAEYIERDKIRRAYEKLTRSYVHDDPYIADWRFDEMIENLTASDVAPVRHGRWLTWEEQFPGEKPRRSNNLGVFCDKCHNHADNRTDFCPHCGAKMDKEDSQCDT